MPEPTPEAAELDDLLYRDPLSRTMRSWCAAPTSWLADQAASSIRAALETDGSCTVVDFGSGTGAAVHALAGVLDKAERDAVELVLVDLPGPWFDDWAADRVRGWWPRVDAASLRSDERILLLDEVRSGVQVVVSSMVFHLIPDRALDAAIGGIARALAPGGTLVWTAPDIAPAAPGSVLFHDSNRLLRHTVVEAIESGALAERYGPNVAQRPTPETIERAERQVLATPRSFDRLHDALARHLHATSSTSQARIALDDLVRSALLTPNLALVNEVSEPLRRDVATRLMRDQVLPELPADTDQTVALTWASGTAVRPVTGGSHGDSGLLRSIDDPATL